MLKFFRRRDTVVRFMLGGFLVVICISMVYYLIPQGAGNDATTPIYQQTIASVDGQAITGQDFTDQLTRVEQTQQIPAQLVPMFGRQILRNLVEVQALDDQAAQLGLSPSDAEIVASAQQQAPQLYPNGKYIGDAQAAQFLAQNQMTLAQFQTQLRQDLMASKVYDLVTDPVRVSDAEVQAQFDKDNTKAVIDYVVLSPTALQAQIQATPAQLEAYYNAHKGNYTSPERRQIEVLLANQTAIGAQIPVSNAEVDQYYQQNIASFSHPEQVKASHILIKFPDSNPTPAEIAATKAKAEDVLKQVQAKPADFAALAKKYSQDPGSAAQGGELGFIQRNQTVANFEKVAFSLPVGQISGLVQTEYGFHIIKVEAHTPAATQSEAEVHDQIVAAIQKNQALDKAQALMNQAETLAAKMPLQQVAQQLNLQYFSTAPIGRTDPVTGVGVNPDFASAVFSVASGGLTPPVQVAQGFAMAKVDAIVPPGTQPFSAVQDAVTTDYKTQQAQQLATQRANALQQAAAKQGLKAAAAALHLTVKTSAPLTRGGSLPDAGAISGFADTLFALKPGEVGPVAAVTNNGEMVYALAAIQPPTAADFAAQSASITQNLVQQKRDAVFAAYTDALLDRMQKAGKIKYYDDAFQRVLGAASGQPAGSPGTPAPVPAAPNPLGLG